MLRIARDCAVFIGGVLGFGLAMYIFGGVDNVPPLGGFAGMFGGAIATGFILDYIMGVLK